MGLGIRRRCLAASFTLFAAAAFARSQPPTLDREASAEIQDFIRAAIADRFNARDIPDISLLRDRTHVLVLKELPNAKLRLRERALPEIPNTQFELISLADAEAMAARTGRDVIYIAVDNPHIERATATISIGVDLTMPRSEGTVKMCCCSGRAEFRRTAEHWAFVKWISETCS